MGRALNLLHPPAIKASLFSWDGRHGISELSTLQGHGFRVDRVYNDACDLGFTMHSDRTGKTRVLRSTHRENNQWGALSYWDFESVPEEKGLRLTVRIFND